MLFWRKCEQQNKTGTKQKYQWVWHRWQILICSYYQLADVKGNYWNEALTKKLHIHQTYIRVSGKKIGKLKKRLEIPKRERKNECVVWSNCLENTQKKTICSFQIDYSYKDHAVRYIRVNNLWFRLLVKWFFTNEKKQSPEQIVHLRSNQLADTHTQQM